MKKLLYVFATAALTITMSCGNTEKANQSEKSTEDSLRADSVKKVEMAIEAQRQDSIRRDSIAKDSIRQDSLLRYRETPDLALFELHGPVKSVTYKNRYLFHKNEGFTLQLSYNEDGKLKGINGSTFNRDGNGRIKSIMSKMIGEEDNFYITYDKNNRPIKIKNEGMEWYYDQTYKYNASGFVSSLQNKGGEAGCGSDISTTYSYKTSDKYGNWTSRSYVSKIVNYEDDIKYGSRTETGTDYRTITYYEK